MREDFEGTRVVTVPAEERAAVTARLKRRRTARILCGVLIPVVVLTVFFAVMLNVRTLGVGTGNTDGAYGTVLADIEGITEANPES